MNATQFRSLPVRKRRILLAKDVLKQLAAKKYLETRGSYVEFDGAQWLEDEQRLDSKFFQQMLKEKTCSVCAKGALVCAYADKYNSINLADAQRAMNNDKMKRMVGTNFWDSLEVLFEGWDENGWDTPSGKEALAAKVNPKGKEYSLKYLMQNIIDNRGILKIGKLVVE